MKKRADVLVHESGIADSREKAKRLIMEGKIYVDQNRVFKPGEQFDSNVVFTLKGENLKYVSRGGYKLEKAIDDFKLDLDNKICADFGASTGGFTDCMIQNGAKKVYSIDVGYGQLDWKIRSDDRVIAIERTNLRYLDNDLIKDDIDFISIDVSFISLTLILPKAFEIIEDSGEIVALIKPQFEASREEVGKNGIIRSDNIRIKTVEKVYDFIINNDYIPLDLTYSPITGTQGNIEFLIHIKKYGQCFDRDKIKEIINNATLNLGD